MRDRHYRMILGGLEGTLDPSLFEACVVDLLSAVYPGLVPIHGGQDYGMDGAIADGLGEAYPLIVTTSEDVSGNLKKNLDSYARGGGPRREVVVATSTELTGRRRRNLRERAREKGFTLVQVHDRQDLARRLYRRSDWARNLLGLTGSAPSLSAVPPSRYPTRGEIELVGREADLAWLAESSGDRLIVGQPGAGKTSVLLRLVERGEALFLARDDEWRIAEDLRDERPRIVLVDDAHLDPQQVARLRRLREEICGASTGEAGVRGWFDLLATAWPGAEDDVLEAMARPPRENVRELELLTRRQIVEILRSMGIGLEDDDPRLRALVDQAANKPGLAVTLGSLFLRGEELDVFSGQAIRRSLIPALRRVLESDPTDLLACFALGGNRGVAIDSVREFLGVDRESLHRRVTAAAHGGVLRVVDREEGRLAVEPEALRSALLQEAFFTGPGLPYRELLAQESYPPQAVETLVAAALRRVAVPADDLRELVSRHGPVEAWQGLAYLGRSEACWVLEHFPGPLGDVAPSALEGAPEAAIQRLLGAATEAEGALHSTPAHPLRILEDWVQGIPRAHPGRSDLVASLKRRGELVEGAERYRLAGGDDRLAVRVSLMALSARLEGAGRSATGDSMVVRRGVLPPGASSEILKLWAAVRPRIEPHVRALWREIEEVLRSWVHPHVYGRMPTTEELDRYQSVARRVILDLVEVADGHPGLATALAAWGEKVGAEVALPESPGFSTLFPEDLLLRDAEDADGEIRQAQAAADLAERLSREQPEATARRLAFFGEEARAFLPGHRGWHTRVRFASALAENVTDPMGWLDAMMAAGLEAPWLSPLLERIVAEGVGANRAVGHCLEADAYRWLGALAAIRAPELSEQVLETALAEVPEHIVEVACDRGEVPVSTLRRLLRHPRRPVALAAAVGEWLADPRGTVRPELEGDWRSAVRRARGTARADRIERSGQHHWMREILSSDDELASEWFRARLEGPSGFELASDDGLYAAAASALAEGQRIALLRLVEPSRLAGSLARLLVGDSVAVFRRLLERPDLRPCHLECLGGRRPDGTWAALAQEALIGGHPPQEIVELTLDAGPPVVRPVTGVGYWLDWVEAFRAVREDAEGVLRTTAELGVRRAQERVEEARRQSRRIELAGLP